MQAKYFNASVVYKNLDVIAAEESSGDSNDYTEEELSALIHCVKQDEYKFLAMLEERKELYARSATPCQGRSKNGLVILYDLDFAIDVNSGNPSIILAVDANKKGVVQALLLQKANPNVVGACGFTALHTAAREGYADIVRVLLENGADFSLKNDYGDTALHCGALSGNLEVVRILIEKGAGMLLNVRNKEGKTPADYMTKACLEAVKALRRQCFEPVFRQNVDIELNVPLNKLSEVQKRYSD